MTKKPTGNEIRQTFIDFFVEHGHTAVPSMSLDFESKKSLIFFRDFAYFMHLQLQWHLSIAHIHLDQLCRSMKCHSHPHQL